MPGYVADEWEGEILNNIHNKTDTRNVDFLNTLNPAFSAMVKELIVRARIEFGYNLVITDGFRTSAEQDEMYAIGRTPVEFNNVLGYNVQITVPDSRRTITKARGGESYHQYGFAVDIANITSRTSFNYNHTFDKDFMKMAKEIGLVSGMSFGDRPHFHQSFGQHWSELKNK